MTAEEIRRMEERVAQVRAEMERACRAAGRAPGEVLLCAASKTQNSETVRAAAALDIDLFGENRVQELCEKYAAGAYSGKPLHFIGHLQTNKVRQIVDKVSMVESVDSVKLAREIDRHCAAIGKVMDVLLEVNIGREENKTGVFPELLPALLEEAGKLEHIRVRGLMTIPPVCETEEEVLQYFSQMRQLFIDIKQKKYDNISMEILSMGMSADYLAAVRCGSNIVRIGTAMFGQRNYKRS